jgi:cell division transport system permease protein
MSKSNKSIRGKKTLGSYPYFTVMLSITLALFVIGLFALIFVHAQKLSGIAQENIEMNIILEKSIQENQRKSLQRVLSTQPYLLKLNQKPQIAYISEEEAKKKFIQTHGQDFTKVLPDNPLHASYIIKIQPQFSDSLSMSKISGQIQSFDGVKEVFYLQDIITKVNNNIRTISLVLGGFALILLLASILLINNTIKLALYSQRFLIRSMQLVGATKFFIQRPFIIRAIIQGFVSGGIAAVGLYALLNYAYNEIEYLKDLYEAEIIITIMASLLIGGAIIGFLSSWRAVIKYLNMSLDELY